MTTSERIYPIHRPLAAFCAGAAVAVLGGLIGLGGAVFRLPILIAVFELYPHRAIRINLLISLATLAVSAATRLGVLGTSSVANYAWEIVAMTVGGVLAGWVGANLVTRIPRPRLILVISVLLGAVAVLLVIETVFKDHTALSLPDDASIRMPAALVSGVLVGCLSSLSALLVVSSSFPPWCSCSGGHSYGRDCQRPHQCSDRCRWGRTSLACWTVSITFVVGLPRPCR
jgi:uncharacterized membrane protein YfcA